MCVFFSFYKRTNLWNYKGDAHQVKEAIARGIIRNGANERPVALSLYVRWILITEEFLDGYKLEGSSSSQQPGVDVRTV